MIIRYQKKTEDAISPTMAYGSPLGLDLHTPLAVTISPGSSTTIDTGIQVEIPDLHSNVFRLGGFIHSKSGLSVKSNIEKGAGVIDPDYTGTLVIKLFNHGKEYVHFKRGDKIAQFVLMVCPVISALEEADLSALETERGENGFGSSGA